MIEERVLEVGMGETVLIGDRVKVVVLDRDGAGVRLGVQTTPEANAEGEEAAS